MRYKRQEAIIGEAGQNRLREASVLIIGAGALGSVSAELLARAGVGKITIQDFDIVELDNLQRQSLYTEEDVGVLKTLATTRHLQLINSDVRVETINGPFSADSNVKYDIILDGTDNMETRLVINDRAKQEKVDCVFATASQTRGLVFPMTGDACWQCVVGNKKAADSCDDGVVASATHTTASIQVSLAMRILLGERPSSLIEIDAWNGTSKTIHVGINSSCKACRGEYVHLKKEFTLHFCDSRMKLHARPSKPTQVDLEKLDAEQRYPSAARVKLGEGFVLVHRHGLMEFDNVEREKARKFAKKTLGLG